MKRKIPCKACQGCGTVDLPVHLLAVLSLLKKSGPMTAELVALNLAHRQVRAYENGQSAYNNRLETLRGMGFVSRVKNGKVFTYSLVPGTVPPVGAK